MSPNPQESPPLSAEGLALIDKLLGKIPAHEVTVWLQDEDGDRLQAIYNPVNPKMIGLSQPVSKGLISQALVTGLPLLEPDVTRRNEHDPTIDSLTGQTTRALMAAPICSGADIIGVVSAVQLAGTAVEHEFHDRDLGTLDRAAREFGKLMASSSGESAAP